MTSFTLSDNLFFMKKSVNPIIAHIVGLILYFLGLVTIVFGFNGPTPVLGVSAGFGCIALGAILGLLHDIEQNTRK